MTIEGLIQTFIITSSSLLGISSITSAFKKDKSEDESDY